MDTEAKKGATYTVTLPDGSTDTYTLAHEPKHAVRWHDLPPAWRPLIARAKEAQINLKQSDGVFSGTQLSGPAWNQLVNGSYPVPTTEAGVRKMTASLTAILKRGRDELAKQPAQKAAAAPAFVQRQEYDEVVDCLEDAARNADAANEERVVVIVGATRNGKSTLIKQLMTEHKIDWRLRATASTKRSYKRFLRDIAATLKLRDIEGSNVKDLEDSILKKLDKVKGVLAIEELQSFSPSALEFLKLLLNDSQVSLVICMLPGQLDRMTRSTGEDMQQFLGRSVGIVHLKVTDDLVTAFNPSLWKGCPEASALKGLIVTEANKGGGVSLVRDVTRDANLLASATGGLKRHHVEDALKDYRRKVPAMALAA